MLLKELYTDSEAVPQLKAALLAQKTKIKAMKAESVYKFIDEIMQKICKAHGLSGQQLHDMWVKKYKEVPDTWIMHS